MSSTGLPAAFTAAANSRACRWIRRLVGAVADDQRRAQAVEMADRAQLFDHVVGEFHVIGAR
jgi:hypothetical protein